MTALNIHPIDGEQVKPISNFVTVLTDSNNPILEWSKARRCAAKELRFPEAYCSQAAENEVPPARSLPSCFSSALRAQARRGQSKIRQQSRSVLFTD